MSNLELPYFDDATDWFEILSPLGKPMLLDGANHSRANNDIITAGPSATLALWPERLELTQDDQLSCHSPAQFFELLRKLHQPESSQQDREARLFTRGLIGYIGYDVNQVLDAICPIGDKHNPTIPTAFVSRYDWAVVQCHGSHRAWLTVQDHKLHQQIMNLVQQYRERCDSAVEVLSDNVQPRTWTASTSLAEYQKAIAAIHGYINAGDCYQVNYTQRFSATYSESALAIYKRVKRSVQSPFNALIPVSDDQAVISVSPERLVQLKNSEITTQPIKGTMPRFDDPAADQAAKETLVNSEKDRAENLMIVDLLRNDIGRVAKPSSVKVSKLFDVEPYANVFHLVSTIKAQLDEQYDAVDLLEATLPGGSITGAPKIRAMEIIEELESTRRSAYCGTIFYLSSHGNLDSNVAIRTLVKDQDALHIWGGGGIVADSNANAEQAESRNKIRAFVSALGGELEHDQELENG
ncbi:aminodeoxychorismate synthase component I [Umboniibacter marinipuniceus]|uniref:aminodeoxychorismate synthase n=1 Tax=Umboniibacter marinipuniceus TaxID=569599 RepID=A0A3M0A7X0_9GAMM|nr:aminodeoxychorismate synthase component I [Umboniibacter marinipuniceus]RMA81251.1 aminodeoxychorismate synthase subunit I [Umboniibacter marinipuniceus]